MNIQDIDLTILRQAVFDNQWQEQQQILCNVFASNVSQSTLFVAHEMVLSSLRLQQYFDVKWVDEFAEKISRFIELDSPESLIPSFPSELEADYSNDPPGVPEFKGGVELLWQSLSVAYHPHEIGTPWILPYSIETHVHHQTPEKVGVLVRGLESFVTGEVCHYWANAYPEEWKLMEVFYNADKDSNGSPILPEDTDYVKLGRGIRFLKEPESIGYEVARWLNLIDEIEMRLKQQRPS